jgi:hypothetical protein
MVNRHPLNRARRGMRRRHSTRHGKILRSLDGAYTQSAVPWCTRALVGPAERDAARLGGSLQEPRPAWPGSGACVPVRPHGRRQTQYTRAAATRPARTYARIVAPDVVSAARTELRLEHIEQACATWRRALEHMDGVWWPGRTRTPDTRFPARRVPRLLAPSTLRHEQAGRSIAPRAGERARPPHEPECQLSAVSVRYPHRLQLRPGCAHRRLPLWTVLRKPACCRLW